MLDRATAGPLILGCMTFDRVDPNGPIAARHEALLDAAIEHGVCTLDTAPLYGFGASETWLGAALRRRPGVRVRVLTKVGLRWDAEHGAELFRAPIEGRMRVVRKDARPEAIRADLEASCRRLQTDTLDFVHVHHRDSLVPLGETADALVAAYRAGRIRGVGLSNHSATEIEEFDRILRSKTDGALRVGAVQDRYSGLSREVERGSLRAALAREIPFLAYSPLAQGLLTDPSRRSARDPSDWRKSLPGFQRARRARIDAGLRRFVDPIARRHRVSIAAISLAWLLAQPGVSSAIAGARDREQLEDWVRGRDVTLRTTELQTLDEGFASLVGVDAPSLVSRLWGLLR